MKSGVAIGVPRCEPGLYRWKKKRCRLALDLGLSTDDDRKSTIQNHPRAAGYDWLCADVHCLGKKVLSSI